MQGRGHLERPAKVGQRVRARMLQDLGHGGNHYRHRRPWTLMVRPIRAACQRTNAVSVRHSQRASSSVGVTPSDVDEIAQIRPHLDFT